MRSAPAPLPGTGSVAHLPPRPSRTPTATMTLAPMTRMPVRAHARPVEILATRIVTPAGRRTKWQAAPPTSGVLERPLRSAASFSEGKTARESLMSDGGSREADIVLPDRGPRRSRSLPQVTRRPRRAPAFLRATRTGCAALCTIWRGKDSGGASSRRGPEPSPPSADREAERWTPAAPSPHPHAPASLWLSAPACASIRPALRLIAQGLASARSRPVSGCRYAAEDEGSGTPRRRPRAPQSPDPSGPPPRRRRPAASPSA